jgi:hypothetical protein
MQPDVYSPSSDATRAQGQLELFASTAAALPLAMSPRPCRCGCLTAVLGSSRGPHAGELRCADCGVHVMWASHAFVAEIRSSDFVSGLSTYAPGCRP